MASRTLHANSITALDADVISLRRLFSHGVIALIVALTFLNLNHNYASLQYRVFVMFFASVR